MNKKLKIELFAAAEDQQTKSDPSHDFEHIKRVCNMALKIAEIENADIDIILPAALFHDAIVYPKDSPNSQNETIESAAYARKVLGGVDYPEEKITAVEQCIRECSFSKGIKPDLLESKILQDADRLEATGAISIMRTFASCGQMKRCFYNSDNPLSREGEEDAKTGIGLFYRRLLVVAEQMHTETARVIAQRRTAFLKSFLDELEVELKESDILR